MNGYLFSTDYQLFYSGRRAVYCARLRKLKNGGSRGNGLILFTLLSPVYYRTMRTVILGIYLFFQLTLMAAAQPARAFDPNNLRLTLEHVALNYPKPGQSRFVLTFANTGQQAFPATGWKLFFNTGSMQSADTAVAQLKQYNGDLFFLAPGSRFKLLPAGGTRKVEIIGRTIKNKTDFPGGFYLVWNEAPARGFPVAVDMQQKVDLTKANQALAAKYFNQQQKTVDIPVSRLTKILPTPVAYQEQGAPFTLDNTVVIRAAADFKNEADYLANELALLLGKKPELQAPGAGKGIALQKNTALAAEEYQLRVNADGITVSAATAAGIFYGIQSMKSLLPPAAFTGKESIIRVPGVVVQDAPRFGYRGFMMDMARNFQPKAQVLKILDLLALYKMNVLHFHFSEDEGWRLEIPSLPELTAVGGTRAHTADTKTAITPSYGSGAAADNTTGTGFYRRADFVEILQYARDRHIRVIPEIESPGHARAAIKAMDARYDKFKQAGNQEEAERYLLRDLKDQSVYRSIQGWDDNVMDVAQPATYRFLERVVDDIIAMYQEAGAPLTTIHFGGDEVPAGVWEKSPAVQQLMRQDKSVKSPDDLWYYYFGKVNQILKARNLYLSGWEEIGLKKVVQNGKVNWVPNETFANENFHVNVWKNTPGSGAEDLAYRMANAGYKVILTGVTHLYLDMSYNTAFAETGQYWGGYVDTDKPFSFIPYDYLRNLKEDDRGNPLNKAVIKSKETLTAAGRANIVGMEAPLWAETIKTPAQQEYLLLPKLLGVAERAWAKDPVWATEKEAAKSQVLYNQAWSEFANVVGKRELPRLDAYRGGYRYRIPTAGAVVKNNQVVANVQFPGLLIRYTTDGTEPTDTSPVYTQPIRATGTVKLKVFNAAGRAGETLTLVNPK